MPESVYEVVAQAARYWFAFLMLVIVWRSYRWFRRDRRQRKKRLRLLPDAGFVGELVVLRGGDALAPGDALPLPREGMLGFLRTCDVCVPVAGVGKKHLWFTFDEETGLTIEPYHGMTVAVDGETRKGRRDPLRMHHGSRLTVGEAVLRMRLFAGFEDASGERAPAAYVDGNPADMRLPDQTAALDPAALLMQQQAALNQQSILMMQQLLMQQQAAQMGAGAPGAAAQPGTGMPGAVAQPGAGAPDSAFADGGAPEAQAGDVFADDASAANTSARYAVPRSATAPFGRTDASAAVLPSEAVPDASALPVQERPEGRFAPPARFRQYAPDAYDAPDEYALRGEYDVPDEYGAHADFSPHDDDTAPSAYRAPDEYTPRDEYHTPNESGNAAFAAEADAPARRQARDGAAYGDSPAASRSARFSRYRDVLPPLEDAPADPPVYDPADDEGNEGTADVRDSEDDGMANGLPDRRPGGRSSGPATNLPGGALDGEYDGAAIGAPDGLSDETADWPYLPPPSHPDVSFRQGGYTYPEYVEASERFASGHVGHPSGHASGHIGGHASGAYRAAAAREDDESGYGEAAARGVSPATDSYGAPAPDGYATPGASCAPAAVPDGLSGGYLPTSHVADGYDEAARDELSGGYVPTSHADNSYGEAALDEPFDNYGEAARGASPAADGYDEADLDEPSDSYAPADASPVPPPDPSLYVEPDEAAKAKRVLWDRYLGRGKR